MLCLICNACSLSALGVLFIVLSCRCCMFVSCVHSIAVINAAFFSSLRFVNICGGCKRGIN